VSKESVLFICPCNSSRSLMAEGLLRHRAPDRFEAHSAGIVPRVVHPLTIHALQRRGISTTFLTSKGLRDIPESQRFDHVVVIFSGDRLAVQHHASWGNRSEFWSIPDPGFPKGNYAVSVAAFTRTVEEIDQHIDRWLTSLTIPAVKD
jgi:arsenate reductase